MPLLLAIVITGHTVAFTFTAKPATVRAAYASRPLAECGSGRPVAVRGVHFVIHFFPARTALSFAAHRRLRGAGVSRELAKVCDFESDLAWAIGLDHRRSYHVTRAGKRVIVTFS